MNMNENVAFVDIETLGLDPERHAVWEIAVIFDEFEVCWQVDLTPEQIAHADPVALGINGFYERRLDGGEHLLSPHASAMLFAKMVEGRHLVGANVSFDEERLRRMHDAHMMPAPDGGERYPWHYHLIDVEAMALGYFHGLASEHLPPAMLGQLKMMPPYRSADLSAMLGVEETPDDEKHTALGDVRWVKRMWHAMTDYVLEAP